MASKTHTTYVLIDHWKLTDSMLVYSLTLIKFYLPTWMVVTWHHKRGMSDIFRYNQQGVLSPTFYVSWHASVKRTNLILKVIESHIDRNAKWLVHTVE